jgi:SAM-dependent methyltransferase
MTDDGWFGEEVASTYDADAATMFEPAALEPAIAFLADLAGDGPALELAIGTGRVAVPLAARGIRVAGIDLSRAMVARLRTKPGGDEASIPVAIGDIATTRVLGSGSFTLVYLVFNTITNLTTQDAQVDCFANAAVHLAPGGCFVVETFVPALRRLPRGERFVQFEVSDTHIGIDEYDVANQGLVSHHTTFADGAARRVSVPFRYVWPAELDLMARLAGMRLRERWADWSRAPFTSESESHVSVWERPGS